VAGEKQALAQNGRSSLKEDLGAKGELDLDYTGYKASTGILPGAKPREKKGYRKRPSSGVGSQEKGRKKEGHRRGIEEKTQPNGRGGEV